ncbi:PadR-like family transcriptional regulator [Clostridium pasteurianum DSM 525 = ATCC 6013]|uniref:PadR-like family transcriptional regulator n=1 Tax=Clostridium pasteurianum DSM 525 = ATCC 6013 TaxID=1262449 RepID=A0A0H3IYS0_CLOPA|nr:helix-turn-helix transcriptional regulator [Clostridium pasteurianum]AJA46681.1 PadR-like family transcriptional regulator [Clostridium pasteurianum DSM 525 = ATCC 6013]AJA50669.1 PadR-like family transcriptional regulator [Clostridium pasteurianum DSM 525 = ATCC 6013]AOZ74089.1 PadR family transcriptional regulator [Clostridium pasteurianum DSM 525 = ATCC 6013]AOZ77886.1 PadR family transcriptional regulator [Clostridium pasteurianum]ELP61246.1 PadR-like family transcriptional regulator [C
MDKEILKGSLDIILLLLLSPNSMYGYAIAKQIKKLANNSLEIGEGTLYPALKRLEEKKYLDSYWGVKNRKYYKTTEKGKIELKNKLDNWNIVNNLIQEINLYTNSKEDAYE